VAASAAAEASAAREPGEHITRTPRIASARAAAYIEGPLTCRESGASLAAGKPRCDTQALPHGEADRCRRALRHLLIASRARAQENPGMLQITPFFAVPFGF